MDFKPLLRPAAQPEFGMPNGHSFLRSQFRIETFMVCGALIQAGLSAILPLRYAFVPAAAIALVKVADMYAAHFGWKANPHMMDGNIKLKYSAQLPDKTGSFGNQPARESIAVFLIGARCNSALGLLDKNFKELGGYMERMIKELQADPEAAGYLGSSFWQGAERASNPAVMQLMYFKSAADVHRYAHGPLHRSGWDWWNKNLKDLGDMSIFHELYEVPSGNYEAVYAQMPPMMLAKTQHKVVQKTESGTEEVWVTPVVDASRGQLKSSKGRMARSKGTDNDKYGYDEDELYGKEALV